jgi:hypothetical protein
MIWTTRVRKNRYGSQPGDELFQQFEILAEDFRTNGIRQSGDIPPGRARLAMSPCWTGLSKPIPTMGIVCVAFLAASAAGVGEATMTSTLSPVNSFASSGSASARPSAYRYSIMMFWPSIHPSSRSPSWKNRKMRGLLVPVFR